MSLQATTLAPPVDRPSAADERGKTSYSSPRPLAARIVRGLARRVWQRADEFAVSCALRFAGLRNARSIPTWTTSAELTALYELALSRPPGARVLEIGSYLGASTCYLGAALVRVGGTLTCVDTWQNETMPEGERDTYAEFLKNVAPIRDRLTLVRKRCEDLRPSDLAGPFHLIFLDGDHSYEATKREFELAAGMLAEGGVIACHDAACFEGVARVVGEMMSSGQWRADGIVGNLLWMSRAVWGGGTDL